MPGLGNMCVAGIYPPPNTPLADMRFFWLQVGVGMANEMSNVSRTFLFSTQVSWDRVLG